MLQLVQTLWNSDFPEKKGNLVNGVNVNWTELQLAYGYYLHLSTHLKGWLNSLKLEEKYKNTWNNHELMNYKYILNYSDALTNKPSPDGRPGLEGSDIQDKGNRNETNKRLKPREKQSSPRAPWS